MALKIRLARAGAKKQPYYRIVVADARSPRDGKFIEKVGVYNPMLERTDSKRIVLNEERLKYWVSVGAQPTDRVAKFLGNAKIIEAPKMRETPTQSQPKKKAQERLKEAAALVEKAAAEKAAAVEAAALAKAEAAVAAKAALDAPVVEPVADVVDAPVDEVVDAPVAEEPASEVAVAETEKAPE